MILEITQLIACYGASQILFGIDLQVDQAETVCILGRNGVGKSTTLKTVMGLVIFEALIISLLGGILGLLLGHGLISIGAHFIKVETGVNFAGSYLSLADWLAVPGTVLLGLIAGLFPGVQAYRLGVLKSLSPIS